MASNHGVQLIPFQSLDVYVVAREFAARVHSLSLPDAELRDQARRASKSAFLNLAEGLPADSPGLRRRAFSLAQGSLCESAAALDLAAALGLAPEAEAAALVGLAARLKAMLRGLTGGGR
jgi:four helix bundle protein